MTEVRIQLRGISAADADDVAGLHAKSWRASYRGILRDSYLDGPIFEERTALWRGRLAGQAADQLGLVAVSGQRLIGFVYAFVDYDERWGTLLDNLHVLPAHQGGGVGRRLMTELAHELVGREAAGGVHLWVFDANRRARRLYERLGARVVGGNTIRAPGGGEVTQSLYAWESAAGITAQSGFFS